MPENNIGNDLTGIRSQQYRDDMILNVTMVNSLIKNYLAENVYTKEEVDALLDGKQDKA